MAAKAFDFAVYDRLLTGTHPKVPHTPAENEALITQVRALQQKKRLSPEEQEFMELLLTLVEKFEDNHYSTKHAQPHEVLKELMRTRGLQPKDVYDIFGSRGTTSEVLRGKRGISKAAVKALAELFNVSAELFL